MKQIEVIILLLLLLMALPDALQKLGRPALVFPAFILFGLIVQPFANPEVVTLFREAGQVGFLLLLFEVGLEIDLPPWRQLLRPLRMALLWSLVQYPFILVVGVTAGLEPGVAWLAAATLTACSVGMAHPAWKSYAALGPADRQYVLSIMVILEVVAIVVLAMEAAFLKSGARWIVIIPLLGIITAVFLISRFAEHLTSLFQLIITRTTHWRTHFVVLLVLVICALGQRMGLSAPKTAFFLGLFLSRARHDGLTVEDFIAPISRRFLIPVFFAGLGMMVPWRMLFTWTAVLAFGTGMLLLAVREILHRRWLRLGGDRTTYLLFCPNLTIVALGANELLVHNVAPEAAAWLVLTGLVMTVVSLLMLPRSEFQPTTGTVDPVTQGGQTRP